MSNVVKFPATKQSNERLQRIAVQRDIKQYDDEIAAIHAKVDYDIISKHGSMEEYGKSIISSMFLGKGFYP